MVRRKDRLPVVFDTNVLVRALKTQDRTSPNLRTMRLWLVEGKLQLILSDQLVEEYLQVFSQVLHLPDNSIEKWRNRFACSGRCTCIELGRRYTFCRDADDNLLLAIAHAGRAKYLISNDKDLLELSEKLQREFSIVTPEQFLQNWTGR